MRCPICKKPVEESARPTPAGATPAPAKPAAPPFPFCSERCKLIDLGRWLDGKYQVPAVDDDPDEV